MGPDLPSAHEAHRAARVTQKGPGVGDVVDMQDACRLYKWSGGELSKRGVRRPAHMVLRGDAEGHRLHIRERRSQ